MISRIIPIQIVVHNVYESVKNWRPSYYWILVPYNRKTKRFTSLKWMRKTLILTHFCPTKHVISNEKQQLYKSIYCFSENVCFGNFTHFFRVVLNEWLNVQGVGLLPLAPRPKLSIVPSLLTIPSTILRIEWSVGFSERPLPLLLSNYLLL
jgi:hypothetical protein